MNTIVVGLLFCLAMATASAQFKVVLSFVHKLDGQAYSPETIVQKDNYFYRISSLRYYVSNIDIVFTNGEVLHVPDAIALEDVNGAPKVFTFDTSVNSRVDSVVFNVGVGILYNHTDPASYPKEHPLAYQDPTMHWGWAAGYRFVTLEGYTGSSPDNLATNYQIHAFGDSLYTQVKLDVEDIYIDLHHLIRIDAEYANALDGIDVSFGLVEHSDDDSARVMMNNFGSVVFTDGNPTDVTGEMGSAVSSILAYPNPSHELLTITSSMPDNTPVVLFDTYGRALVNGVLTNGRAAMNVSSLSTGTYTIVAKNNHHLESVRVSVRQ